MLLREAPDPIDERLVKTVFQSSGCPALAKRKARTGHPRSFGGTQVSAKGRREPGAVDRFATSPSASQSISAFRRSESVMWQKAPP